MTSASSRAVNPGCIGAGFPADTTVSRSTVEAIRESRRKDLNTNGSPSERNGSGVLITWKCRCGASELPVLPSAAMTCPVVSRSPTSTFRLPVLRCA